MRLTGPLFGILAWLAAFAVEAAATGFSPVDGFLASDAAGNYSANPRLMTGGILQVGETRALAPAAQARPFAEADDPSNYDPAALRQLEATFDEKGQLLSILILNQGAVILEKYRSPADAGAPMFSNSMSKTLTAYAVGQALCSGAIRSLDDRIDTYFPGLGGTVYGENTLRHALTMTGGSKRPPAKASASHRQGQWEDAMSHRRSILENMMEFPQREIEPGREFVYSNADTLSLAFALQGSGGFIRHFEDFWNTVGAEADAHWHLDRTGLPIANGGFSANTRDWGRIALRVLDILNREGASPCLRNYFADAVRTQVVGMYSNVKRSYGFQTWGRKQGMFAMEGFGGQRVMVDPRNELVLILFSAGSSASNAVTDIFYDLPARK